MCGCAGTKSPWVPVPLPRTRAPGQKQDKGKTREESKLSCIPDRRRTQKRLNVGSETCSHNDNLRRTLQEDVTEVGKQHAALGAALPLHFVSNVGLHAPIHRLHRSSAHVGPHVPLRVPSFLAQPQPSMANYHYVRKGFSITLRTQSQRSSRTHLQLQRKKVKIEMAAVGACFLLEPTILHEPALTLSLHCQCRYV